MILICCVFVANINRELHGRQILDRHGTQLRDTDVLFEESRMATFKMTKTFGITIIQFCCMESSNLKLFDWNMRISRHSQDRIISLRQLLINLVYSFQIWQDYWSGKSM